jgi:diaminopimelate epimerase
MEPLRVCWKLFSEGNSYVVVQDEPGRPPNVQFFNSAGHGFGGDGVLSVAWLDSSRCQMKLWNRDGSTAGLCLNGARGVAALGVSKGFLDPLATIEVRCETATVRHVLQCRDRMRFSSEVQFDRKPHLARVSTSVVQVDVGVPHRVVFGSLPGADLANVARTHQGAIAGGTNVMFTQFEPPSTLRIFPWERGVGPVGGCASGALAAVMAAGVQDLPLGLPDPVTVIQPAGRLTILAQDSCVLVQGSAQVVAEIFYQTTVPLLAQLREDRRELQEVGAI